MVTWGQINWLWKLQVISWIVSCCTCLYFSRRLMWHIMITDHPRVLRRKNTPAILALSLCSRDWPIWLHSVGMGLSSVYLSLHTVPGRGWFSMNLPGSDVTGLSPKLSHAPWQFWFLSILVSNAFSPRWLSLCRSFTDFFLEHAGFWRNLVWCKSSGSHRNMSVRQKILHGQVVLALLQIQRNS